MRWLGRVVGADGRRCGRTVATTRGQLPLLPTASSELDSGGLVGCWGVCARAVTMRHSASRPRDGRNIAKDRTLSHPTVHFHHRPAPPSSAAQRAQAQTQRKRPRENENLINSEYVEFFCILARSFSLSLCTCTSLNFVTIYCSFKYYFDKAVKALLGQMPSSKSRNTTNATRRQLRRPNPRFHG